MKDEAMKLALEALSTTESDCGSRAWEREQEAITALREALAEQPAPVQEPVATVVSEDEPVTMSWWHEPALPVGTKLYTTPPVQEFVCSTGLCNYKAQRPWVWLTDEDIEQEFGFIDELLRDCVHRTEAKVREKNNG